MQICIYIYIYIYILCVYVHAYVHAIIYVHLIAYCMYIYIYSMCLYMYTHIHIYIHIYICTYVCRHACVYASTNRWMDGQMDWWVDGWMIFDIICHLWTIHLILHLLIIDDSFCQPPTTTNLVKILFGRRLNEWLHRCSGDNWDTWKAQRKTVRPGSWAVMDNMEIWYPLKRDKLVAPLKHATSICSLSNLVFEQLIIHHNLGR